MIKITEKKLLLFKSAVSMAKKRLAYSVPQNIPKKFLPKNFKMDITPDDLLSDGRKLCCVLEPFDTCEKCYKEFCDDCSVIIGSGHCGQDSTTFMCFPCYKRAFAKKRRL